MSRILDILFRKRAQPSASPDSIKQLSAAKKEAAATVVRKALLAREVQATIARLQR